MWRLPDTMMGSRNGLSGCDTHACSGMVRIGRRRSSIAASRELEPATACRMAPACGSNRCVGVRQREMPALGIHDVEVELVAESLKKRNGLRVERHSLDGEIIGAHDRGIAPRVAAAEISFLQDCNVADAVILGE